MQSEPLLGRVVPLPLRSMDTGFRIDDELSRARRLTPPGGASRRSLTSPPDLRVDVIAFSDGGSIERPWRSGRAILQCLQGLVHVTTTTGTRDLVEGDLFSADAASIRKIHALEESAVMATIVVEACSLLRSATGRG